MIIGLTGSIAMGKSEVAKILRQNGIPVFDADAVVHEIYNNGTAAKALKTICPEAITGEKIDRSILAKMISRDPTLLKSITTVIHPLVHQSEYAFREKYENQIAVVDSPLILEAGRAREMDLLIVVSSTPELQRKRALSRPNMTDEKFNMILSKQMPDDEKRKWADYVIENNGSLQDLETLTKSLLDEIKSKHHA